MSLLNVCYNYNIVSCILKNNHKSPLFSSYHEVILIPEILTTILVFLLNGDELQYCLQRIHIMHKVCLNKDFESKELLKQYRDFRGIHICGIVYHICSIVYHICGNFDPQMWYSIPHMWYTQNWFFWILPMIPMPKIQKSFKQ